MTDNEMAFWMFGLPASILFWAVVLVCLVAVWRFIFDN